MGRAGRRLAEAHSIERNVDEILSVYEEVIAGKRPTPLRCTAGEKAYAFSSGLALRAGGMPSHEAPEKAQEWVTL
jgi:hypothetical protein